MDIVLCVRGMDNIQAAAALVEQYEETVLTPYTAAERGSLDDVILRRLARVIWVRTEEYAIGHREVWWALYRLRLVGPWPELGRVVPAGSRPSVEDTRAALPCPTLAELLAWATGGAA